MSTNFRRFLTLPALLMSTTAAAACGGDGDPTGAGTSTKATLQVVNTSQNTVMFIRTRSCGSTTWGADLLGIDLLYSGHTFSKQVNPGCVDIRLTPAEVGADYLYFYNVQLTSGQTKSVTAAAFPAE